MMNRDAQWLLHEKYGGTESDAFRADCQRLADGEPLAYVIGHTPFLHCTIHLDSRPLIPRPETEYWTEQCIRHIQAHAHPGAPIQLLDLCAGSGCIGVAIANALPTVQVTFAELESVHLPTIEKNIRHNLPSSTAGRHSLISSDLFAHVSGRFDYIVSNPPYIDSTLRRTEPSVTKYEPAVALYGGHSGYAYLTAIIAAAPQYLRPGGQLWLEHEPEQIDALADSARMHGLHIETHTDQYDVSRYSVLTMAQ